MSGKLYFTQRGFEKLRKDVENLEKKLKELQAQTAYVAEVGGDQYHDNSSYDLLVIDMRGADRRLSEAHRMLNSSVVVKAPTFPNKVAIGTRVKINHDGEDTVWEVAGFGESDPVNNILAYNTPLASLVMGKRKGDVVTGLIAGRKTEIKILDVTKGEIE